MIVHFERFTVCIPRPSSGTSVGIRRMRAPERRGLCIRVPGSGGYGAGRIRAACRPPRRPSPREMGTPGTGTRPSRSAETAGTSGRRSVRMPPNRLLPRKGARTPCCPFPGRESLSRAPPERTSASVPPAPQIVFRACRT